MILAAADLHVTPSNIAQRIKALDKAAGTLFIRRRQPCTATATGLHLVRHHAEIALLNMAQADDLHAPTGPAHLRIAINAASLANWAIPALAETQGLLYDTLIGDQDFSQDLLKSGEVAAAITSHPGPLQDRDTVPLGRLRFRTTASPACVACWFAHGITAQALSHPLSHKRPVWLPCRV